MTCNDHFSKRTRSNVGLGDAAAKNALRVSRAVTRLTVYRPQRVIASLFDQSCCLICSGVHWKTIFFSRRFFFKNNTTDIFDLRSICSKLEQYCSKMEQINAELQSVPELFQLGTNLFQNRTQLFLNGQLDAKLQHFF